MLCRPAITRLARLVAEVSAGGLLTILAFDSQVVAAGAADISPPGAAAAPAVPLPVLAAGSPMAGGAGDHVPDHIPDARSQANGTAEENQAGQNRRFLEERVHGDPEDMMALNRLASTDLQLLRFTGKFDYLVRATVAARQSLAILNGEYNVGGMSVMARAYFEAHRFAEARDVARQLIHITPTRPDGFQVLGDALLELGDIEGAIAAWHEMERAGDGGLDLRVRLARVTVLKGQLDEAQEDFTASLRLARSLDPPSTATMVWCLLQRGQLAFGRGDWDGAEKDYAEARELAPSHYATLEHLAELRGAQRRFPEAISLYQEVIARTERPEFVQALGDLYAFAGRTEEARTAHEQALIGYLKSVGDGNAHYYHHLAGFYCDVQPDPEQALKWARRDIELRQSVYAYDTLAWALYQNGQWPEAAEAARKAVATGIRDAHLLYHAGMILCRAGDLPGGGKLLREVSEANPHYFNTFHVHR